MPNFGLPSARAEASRRNGAKSRGPKTAEGKAASPLRIVQAFHAPLEIAGAPLRDEPAFVQHHELVAQPLRAGDVVGDDDQG